MCRFSMPSQTQYGHTIFLSSFDGSTAEKLTRLHFVKNGSDSAPYDEAWLQRLIVNNPSLLPVGQIEPAFDTLVPVCTELPMKSGFVDNLLMTPAGDIALVECKLWRNPEARREVVAQIIDYAKDLSKWSYENLQDAIQRATKTTQSLYKLVTSQGEEDEAEFHDTVSRNLRRGRFLLLIVGDGIREGMEGMADFLQQHAGFHFVLAFIEIALFEAHGGGYIAQPRVLTRTTNIERAIVALQDGQIVVAAPMGNVEKPKTLTQESYMKQLAATFPDILSRLNAFWDDLAGYNVSPDFRATMILRWHPGNGKSWNLAEIWTNGSVNFETMGRKAKSEGLPDLHKTFLSRLAALVDGASVWKTPNEVGWYVRKNDKYITIDALLADDAHRNGWIQAIAEFQAAVEKASNDD